MLLCLCVQSLASLSVATDSWKMENSVTVATATSVKTPAAITPMKRMAKSVNSNLAKSAGQMWWAFLFFLYSAVLCCSPLKVLRHVWLQLCQFLSTVQAKAHVAQQGVLSKIQMTSADWSPNVLRRARATEPRLCVLPRNQRQTSHLAIPKHKSASVG